VTRRSEAAPADLVRFEWPRMEEVALYNVDGRRVLAGYPNDASYMPLRSEPALFEEFAGLSDDAEAFMAFARAYGDLDDSPQVLVNPPLGEGIAKLGRPLEEWRAHRLILAFAVNLWNAVKEDRAEALMGRELVVVDLPELAREKDGYEQGPQRVEAEVLAPLGSAVHELWLSRPHLAEAEKYHETVGVSYQASIAYLERRNLSPKTVARAALAQLVTTYCCDLSVAMVVTTSMATDAPLRMSFQVQSLIAAMWLQLALAIDGQREYRNCPVCGRWWNATAARSDKLTCSDRCRKSRQREMTREAKEEDR